LYPANRFRAAVPAFETLRTGWLFSAFGTQAGSMAGFAQGGHASARGLLDFLLFLIGIACGLCCTDAALARFRWGCGSGGRTGRWATGRQ
jgi:hypothetical protein